MATQIDFVDVYNLSQRHLYVPLLKGDVYDGRGSDVYDGSGTLIDIVVQAHFGCAFTFALAARVFGGRTRAHAAPLEGQHIRVLDAQPHRTAPFETSVQTKHVDSQYSRTMHRQDPRA